MLSGLYGRAARIRRAWYSRNPHRARRLGRPVVSVGNLVVGGSGKTPVVAALARLLQSAGERPSILSRGYGRRTPGDEVVVVSDGQAVLASAPAAGDEPLMLARALAGVPVLVCADRFRAGEAAERRFGCTVHVLDDGFQHLRLARDVDLLAVAPGDCDERLLPSGRLREPVAAAAVADALLVSGSREEAAALGARLGVATVFRVERRYEAVRLLDAAGTPVPTTAGRRVVAVAGIARPERFVEALRAQGWDVVAERVYRDHHWYSVADIAEIQRAARQAHADLILTTEKDAVRLALPAEARPAWAVLPLQVEIQPTSVFPPWLLDRVAAARRRRGTDAA